MTETSGDAAPPAMETKNLPFGVVPAPVPHVDTTHLDREAAPAAEEPAPEPPAKTARKPAAKDS